jgi:DNA helicase-2/ATP-dependent DNA helicase PcrA
MTRRIASPDTEADRQLRGCLDEHPTRSFVMIAGAGSGKTTSLVKALAHLERTKGTFLRKRGMRIACITFTQVAVEEIRGDVGNATLFHVSTIHSFLWTLVHSFQEDIREWVASRIAERIAEAEEHANRPRTRSTTRTRIAEDIARYRTQLAQLPRVKKFNYGTGSSYGEGLLGHDDILRIGPALIEMYPLLRTIVAQRFPYIFVDESQDTNPEVVAATEDSRSDS